MNTHHPLATERELAAYLSITVHALRKWRQRGEGPPYVKIGRLIRYSWTAIEKFVLESAHDETKF